MCSYGAFLIVRGTRHQVPSRLFLPPFLLSEPANHARRSLVCKPALLLLLLRRGTLRRYILCLARFHVCTSSLEDLSVFCGRSGSLFKPMRVHYCDPSPSLVVPTLTYCGIYASIFSSGFCVCVCMCVCPCVSVGNLSSYAVFFFFSALCEWVSCLSSQW